MLLPNRRLGRGRAAGIPSQREMPTAHAPTRSMSYCALGNGVERIFWNGGEIWRDGYERNCPAESACSLSLDLPGHSRPYVSSSSDSCTPGSTLLTSLPVPPLAWRPGEGGAIYVFRFVTRFSILYGHYYACTCTRLSWLGMGTMYEVLAYKRDPAPAARIPWKATSCRFSPSLDPAASPVAMAPAAHDGRPRIPVFRDPYVPCYTRADGPSKIEKTLCLARRQILRRKSMHILRLPPRQTNYRSIVAS